MDELMSRLFEKLSPEAPSRESLAAAQAEVDAAAAELAGRRGRKTIHTLPPVVQ